MPPSNKTWGPFTGRQLTTIVCVLAVAILFPVGAWAVSFSNVAITDPGGVNRAKVDATGKLAVGDGSGPLTVDGTVAANPSLPAKPIVIITTELGSTATKIYGPQTKPFGITSLTLTDVPLPGCDNQALFSLDSVTSTGGKYEIMDVLLDPGKTVQYVFPTPLVTTPPAGGTASLTAFADVDSCVELSGVGVQN